MFFISKSIGNNIFLLPTEKKNYRQKIHQRSISVGDFVGKLSTNGMIVQIPTENSVGKYKDYGSEMVLDFAKLNLILFFQKIEVKGSRLNKKKKRSLHFFAIFILGFCQSSFLVSLV